MREDRGGASVKGASMKLRSGLVVLAWALGGSAAAATLEEARTAYAQNRIADAERAFAEAGADAALPPEDRAAALRGSARIAWLIDRDAERALSLLATADLLGAGRCETAAMTVRVLDEAALWAASPARKATLARTCSDRREAEALVLATVRAGLNAATSDQARRKALGKARATWRRLSPETKAGPSGARTGLELALLAGDAAAARESWRAYFWLAGSDAPQGLQAYAGDDPFGRGLARAASDQDRLRLLDLLIRAGFGTEAKRWADQTGLSARAPDSPLWRKAAAYFAVRERIEATVPEINRAMARGREKGERIGAEAQAALGTLMKAVNGSGDPRAVILEHYNLFGSVGNTSGYPSVHIGHAVEDRRERIEQYGRAADVRFVVLDNMLANGFETWLWDGSAATGGWTAGPLIVQVRSEYLDDPAKAAALLENGRERREMLAAQAARAAEDLQRLDGRTVTYLPGLRDRLRLQVVDQVAAAVRARATPGEDFRTAFLEEYWRAVNQQSIFVHKGRHAIDETLVTGPDRGANGELEYRAKLSELALADYPKLALWNINAGTIGTTTHHGLANARIMTALADWTKAHAAEVAGYDPSLPAMVQLDKLTDDQLRRVARGLDPLAPKT